MSLIKPLAFNIKKGDLDTASRPLQLLDTVHRTTLMPIARGKVPAGEGRFKDPAGDFTYDGFGADGNHYEGGGIGRTWKAREVIDDFTDLVTDPVMWEQALAGPDMKEGGINALANAPFGLRCYADYVGPGAESYERKGKMLWSTGSSDQVTISGRCFVPAPTVDVALTNCILLGLQQTGSDVDYVFVGVANTATYSRMLVMGESVAGILTVKATVVIPPGQLAVDVAIELDELNSRYRGHYSFALNGEDYQGPNWLPVGAFQPLPAGWPSSAKPRIHAAFPAGHTPGETHRLSDVRNEVESGDFVGEQKATWALEVLDVTNPVALAGTREDCPDEVLVMWCRSADGTTDLTLVDADDPSDPKLWRRWQNIGTTKDWDRDEEKYWTPGWLDADDGHIVLTRNTRGEETGAASGSETGEVWVISLRWDKVLVFQRDGLGVYVSFYDSGTGRMLREASKWAGRRWNAQDTYVDASLVVEFDQRQIPLSPNDFVGTLRDRTSEVTVPAIPYGVSVRVADGGKVYIGYGIQQVPGSIPGAGPCYAGLIELNDGYGPDYPRWLFAKHDVAFNAWNFSDEAWTAVALSYGKAIWWTQAREAGAFDELESALCRRDWTALVKNNASTGVYPEDDFWSGTDVYGGRGFNLFVRDSDPAATELVIAATGWLAGSWLTALWYDNTAPSSSIVRTYGVATPAEPVSSPMLEIMPGATYPEWFMNRGEGFAPLLNMTRFTHSAAQGADSLFQVSEGFALAYGTLTGASTYTLTQELFRGKAIERGDFVLELTGKLIPPFAAGSGLQTIDQLKPTQTWSFALQVRGDRRLLGAAGISIVGNLGGLGGVKAFSSLGWRSNSGATLVGNVVSAPGANLALGAPVRFKIKRSGTVWTLSYWDAALSAYVVLTQQIGLDGPVVPALLVSLTDVGDGAAAGVGVEVDALTLAPSSDAVGKVEDRRQSYNLIPSSYGNIAAGAVFRELTFGPDDARLVIGDAWAFPGLLPHP